LHEAAKNGHVDACRLLIDKGARLDQLDFRGRTPFAFACQSGKEEVAALLLKSSEDQNVLNYNQASTNGKTPFRKAAARGLVKIVKSLLQKPGVKETINDKDKKYGRTALHAAAYNGHKDMVQLLLNSGADSNIEDDSMEKAIVRCYQGWLATNTRKHEETILLLLDRNPEVAARHPELLHAAAMNGSLNIINRLLDLHADPNKCDAHGWTAQHFAKQYGHSEAAELLIKRNYVSSLRPTRMLETQSKWTRLSEDGLEVEHFAPGKTLLYLMKLEQYLT
jgi:serine/threonine-protein phosphatase 6 regulatory ankyrin repeat subunit B